MFKTARMGYALASMITDEDTIGFGNLKK